MIVYLLVFIVIISVIYFYVRETNRDLEGFGNTESSTTHSSMNLAKFKNNLTFYSNIYATPKTIYDRFMSLYFDDICFSEFLYKEQADIVINFLSSQISPVNNILISGDFTGHVNNMLNNNDNMIVTSDFVSHSLLEKSKTLYPTIRYKTKNAITNHQYKSRYTSILNAGHSFYYLDEPKLCAYFDEIRHCLVQNGYLILGYIQDFTTIENLYGHRNHDNNPFNSKYKYKQSKDIDMTNRMLTITETINPMNPNDKNKKHTNKHKLFMHDRSNIISHLHAKGFRVLHDLPSKYKEGYAYLILQKEN